MRRRAEREQDRITSVLRIKEAAVRSSLCPIALCDAEGRIQYANPASLAIWGYTDEHDVIGKFATDFVVSPEVTPAVIADFLQLKTWSGQATARRKDGSTFDARVYVSHHGRRVRDSPRVRCLVYRSLPAETRTDTDWNPISVTSGLSRKKRSN